MYKTRKRSTRRRSYRRGSKKTFNIAKKAARSVIRQQLEVKYFDDDLTVSGISSAGSLFDLTGTTQGDTDLTRTGDKVAIKSLQLRGAVSVGDATNVIRLVLFQFMADSGAAQPTPSNVLQASYISTTLAPFAPFAKDFAGYTIIPLWDKTFALSAVDHDIFTFEVMLTAKDFKKKAKPYIQYQGGGQNGVGNLYLFAISDSGAISHPGLAYVTRFRFLDN